MSLWITMLRIWLKTLESFLLKTFSTFHWFYTLDSSREYPNIHNDRSFMHCNKGSWILSLREKQQMEWENIMVKMATGFGTP